MADNAKPEPKGDILVVDDSPANLRLLSSMLTEQGYKVRSVISGPMALTATRAAPPNLILLDINMPGMSGYEVCRQLKTDQSTLDIPIIFISALDEIGDKLQAFTAGGVDYVTKPFQFEEVLARVETHLALRDLQLQLQEANAELEMRLEELHARNEELDAFAHTVAHDLKNPLSSLLGFGGILEARGNQLPPDQVARAAEAIVRSARKMDSIIEELLLLAGVRKVEKVEMGPLDMATIVAEAQSRLSDLAAEYHAEVFVPEAWPVALGRAAWVEEVWTNYLSNAIKYGGQPPIIHLGFGTFDLGLPGSQQIQSRIQNRESHITFWVRDNGPGLTAEEQVRLFAPFERLHQVRVKGHGLGLSIVRRIVEKLDGQVGVESEPGQGSTFYFTLPTDEESKGQTGGRDRR